MLIGFNSDHFDIPILNKYYTGSLTGIKSVDLMKEIQKVLGRRIGLDAVAGATLGKNKSADGKLANVWWRQGAKDKVVKYCIDDVKITKDLYEYGIKNGKVYFVSNRDYQTYEVPVTWANALSEAKTQKKTESAFPTSLF